MLPAVRPAGAAGVVVDARAAVVGVAAAAEAGAAVGACRVAARPGGAAVGIAAAERRALVAILFCLPVRSLTAQQQAWVMGPQAKLALQELWATSLTMRREQVACLGGTVGPDSVVVTRIKPVNEPSDSLNASAQISLATCAPPEWIGTVHSHVRSTDAAAPASRFSPEDRARDVGVDHALGWTRRLLPRLQREQHALRGVSTTPFFTRSRGQHLT